MEGRKGGGWVLESQLRRGCPKGIVVLTSRMDSALQC